MKSRRYGLPLFAALVVIAVVLVVRSGSSERPSASPPQSHVGALPAPPRSGSDPASTDGALAESALLGRDPVPAAEPVRVSGSLTVFGPVEALGSNSLELDWSADGGASLVSVPVEMGASPARWSFAFDHAGFGLVAARMGERELGVLGEPVIRAETDELDLELVLDGYSVIDVRGGDRAGARIPSVNVIAGPVLASDAIPLTRGKLLGGGDPGSTSGVHDSLGTVDRNNLSVPLVVRTAGLAPRFSLGAPGWRAAEVDGLDAGSLQVVVLHQQHQLHVNFFGLPEVRTHLDVRVLADGETLAEERVQTPKSATLGFDRPANGRVTLQVDGRGTVGGARRLYEAEVELNDGAQSLIGVDLGASLPGWASNAQTFVAILDVNDPAVDVRNWAIKLFPVGGGAAGVSAARELISPLATNIRGWNHAPGTTEYSHELREVAHGDYLLALHPHGLVKRIAVDETTSILRIAPPALGVVEVWPTGATGAALGEAVGLGVLGCEVANDTDMEDGWRAGAAPMSVNMARVAKDHWEFAAPVGATIEVKFLGPSAFGAEVLRLVVEDGRTEATMQFSRL